MKKKGLIAIIEFMFSRYFLGSLLLFLLDSLALQGAVGSALLLYGLVIQSRSVCVCGPGQCADISVLPPTNSSSHT